MFQTRQGFICDAKVQADVHARLKLKQWFQDIAVTPLKCYHAGNSAQPFPGAKLQNRPVHILAHPKVVCANDHLYTLLDYFPPLSSRRAWRNEEIGTLRRQTFWSGRATLCLPLVANTRFRRAEPNARPASFASFQTGALATLPQNNSGGGNEESVVACRLSAWKQSGQSAEVEALHRCSVNREPV
jgi:hypothetical protein